MKFAYLHVYVKNSMNCYISTNRFNQFIKEINDILAPFSNNMDFLPMVINKQLTPYYIQTHKGILVRQGKGKGSFVGKIIKLNQFNIILSIDSSFYSEYQYLVIKRNIDNLLINYPFFALDLSFNQYNF